jgi:hypothetical protein
MPGERKYWADNGRMRGSVSAIALLGLVLGLGGCGSTLSTSKLDLFSTSSKATTAKPNSTETAAAEDLSDIDCPEVQVRTGAATLMIGSKKGEGEPSALDVRYQGTIIRTARECRVTAGVMNIKVGVEGRIITGPAGGPGNVDVPLRIAVVKEGPNPQTIVSKFGREQVTVASAVDRVTFTHIESDISFPMPVPAGLIDAYVVYVGFDPLGEQPARKTPAKRKPRAVKPKQG